MATPYTSFDHLSDRDLLREVTRLAARERHATAQLIASLAAVDARRLHLTEGFSSLFEYCTDSLRLSEHAAYDRITAARAARRFPLILDHLADGRVTLTAVRLLAPHLTDANHATLLAEARHRSKRDVEHMIARLQPQPDVPASVRKLPVPASPQQPAAPASTAPAGERVASPPPKRELSGGNDTTQVSPLASPPSPRTPVVAPIAPARYKISFTIGAETYAKLRQVQDLLRHAVPDGDPAVIYDRALTALLTQLMKTKEVTSQPKTRQTASSEPSPHAGGRPQVGAAPRSRRRIPVDVQRARVAARWWPVHVREPNGAPVRRARVARVSSHGAFRRGRRADGRQRAAVVSRSQPAAGRTRFWTAGRAARAGNGTSVWSQHAATRAGTS